MFVQQVTVWQRELRSSFQGEHGLFTLLITKSDHFALNEIFWNYA